MITPRVLMAGLLLTGGAAAYVRFASPNTGVLLFRPDHGAIQFLVDTNLRPGFTNSQGQVLVTQDSDPMGAIAAAAASWSAVPGANIRFLPLQTTTVDPSPSAGYTVNVIHFARSAEDVSIIGSGFNFTNLQWDESTGAILGSDIIIGTLFVDGTNQQIPLATTHALNTFDLQSFITYEFGFVLGANYSGVLAAAASGYCPIYTSSVTLQESTNCSLLSPDDFAFAADVYNDGSANSLYGRLSGKVSFQNGGPVLGAQVVAQDTQTGIAISGLGSRNDGSFSFLVPPGHYTIYAQPLDGPNTPAKLQLNTLVTTSFRTTFFGGNSSPTPVSVQGGDLVTANIGVDPGISGLHIDAIGSGPPGGASLSRFYGFRAATGGSVLEVFLAGRGLDASITESEIRLLGPGLSLRPGSLGRNTSITFNNQVAIHFTVDVAPVLKRTFASVAIVNGTDAAAISGSLVLEPSGPGPVFPANGVVNAATFLPGPVAPGEIFTLFGTGFGLPQLQGIVLTSAGLIGTTITGTQVLFNDVPAPLIYNVAGQLSGVVPYSVAGKSAVTVRVALNSIQSAAVQLGVAASSPGIFTSDGSGKGQGAILNQDTSINSASNPAAAGDIIAIYATGEGAVTPAVPDGTINNTSFPVPVLKVTVTIGGKSADVRYAGAAPGALAGLLQVNAVIPAGTVPGAVPVVITVGTASSLSTTTVAVK
jgi:uncharacterized protein (TIGR03437 family)